MLNRPLIEEQMAAFPILCYEFFDPRELEFSRKVRWICEHECPMYGRSWACPPGVGTVEQCREKCLSYGSCLLIATVAQTEDLSDLNATLATRLPHERITDGVRDLMRRQGVEPYVLSTEACALCEHCTFPEAPCRHPGTMHPCVESHGINLLPKIAELGLEFQYGDGVITWFSLLFFE